MYLLCPSTTNSRERHLLVRFPEPLFGLSRKGTWLDIRCLVGRALTWPDWVSTTTRLPLDTGRHVTIIEAAAKTRIPVQPPIVWNLFPSSSWFVQVRGHSKKEKNMGCVKPTEFRSTQVLNHCNRSERDRHCDTKPQVLYLLLGYFLTKRDNYPGRRTSWLILLYKSIWKNDSVVGWMGGFLWKMADRALTGRRNNIVLVPLFIALFNRKTSNLLPHKM